MSTGAIVNSLVALLAAGALIAAWAGIRSLQRARKVVFYRTRRTYMTAGWQWLLLALILSSSTVASAIFGEPVVSQFLPAFATSVPILPTATPVSSLVDIDVPTGTATPGVTLTLSPAATRTQATGRTTPQPVTVSSTPTPSRTAVPSKTRTSTVTASPTASRLPSPTENLSALATRASWTLEAQLAVAALSNTPTRTKTLTLTPSLTPSRTPTITLSPTITRNPN